MHQWPRTRYVLLGSLIALQITDFVFTWKLLAGCSHSSSYEANPVARFILLHSGWIGLALFKVIITALALGAIVHVARHRPRMAQRLLAGLCVVVLLVVAQCGHLLAVSTDPTQRIRDQEERDAVLTGQLHALTNFINQRDAILLDLLGGKIAPDVAMTKVAACIDKHRRKLNAYNQKHLPATQQAHHVASYVYFHMVPLARRLNREAELFALGKDFTKRMPGVVLLEPGSIHSFDLPWRQ